MKLELNMQDLGCYETSQRVVFSHEETTETAIPEYCPDIARIVDTAGQLKVREKKLSGGRLAIDGTVKVTVLYTSEESAGLRSLILPVPFTCVIDDQRLQGCRSICASGRLQLAEARAVTARKLYVRVMAEFEVEGISCPEHSVCCDTEEEPSLQIRREEKEIQLLTGVWEREFNFNQEYMPEPGRGVPEDLLLDRISLRFTGCQRISAKLIVKGEACVSLLYRAENGELSHCDAVLPFSQILDAMDLPEEALYQAEVWVTDSDVRLVHTESGCGFGISMRIGVLLKAYEEKKISYISDLYSIRYDTQVQYQNRVIMGAQPPQSLRQEAVQQLEFGQNRPFLCVTGLECGSVAVVPEGERTGLHTNLRLKLLYLDESGTPVSTERTVELRVQIPCTPETARAACAPVVINHSGSSCELRIPVDFFWEQMGRHRLNSVDAVELQELESNETPSVVLRRTEPDDDLWSIAKAYRADPAVVERVNGLEPGARLPEGMLLIPKKRG